jgi:hypothetical protein
VLPPWAVALAFALESGGGVYIHAERLLAKAGGSKRKGRGIAFVKKQGLEGIVAKWADSIYQPGMRSGLWSEHRINMDQEFAQAGCALRLRSSRAHRNRRID